MEHNTIALRKASEERRDNTVKLYTARQTWLDCLARDDPQAATHELLILAYTQAIQVQTAHIALLNKVYQDWCQQA